jgi:Peptidase A4 family
MATTSTASANVKLGPMVPAISQGTSYNWAGYAALSATPITKAEGSWVQPSVTCDSSAKSEQWVVFWVGIDGYGSGTVEQTGTMAQCPKGSSTPEYNAWYEFYPAEDIIVVSSMTVTPGDVFQGVIVGSSATSFKVTLTDVTTGAKFSFKNPTGFVANRESAECVTETPSGVAGFFLLPNFGTAYFGKDNTAVKKTCELTVGGVVQPIGSFGSNSIEITMCNYSSCSTTLVQPSSISKDQTSFTDTWENAGP